MRVRLFTSALLNLRNLLLLLLFVGSSYTLTTIGGLENVSFFAYATSIVLYLGFVIQSLYSKPFNEQFYHKQKIREVQDLNFTCLALSKQTKKNVNSVYMKKLRSVMDDKNDILNSFFSGEKGFIKEKIVEQTLKLVISYIKLLNNFCIRSRELNVIDVSQIIERINSNKRKLDFLKDINASEDIKKVIEMDERMIQTLKEEKIELDRISTKLDYMESTVHMFKRQVLSSLETEEMLESLESSVNEASALDSVLDERRKNKLKM